MSILANALDNLHTFSEDTKCIAQSLTNTRSTHVVPTAQPFQSIGKPHHAGILLSTLQPCSLQEGFYLLTKQTAAHCMLDIVERVAKIR
jgi:hypothetical protein